MATKLTACAVLLGCLSAAGCGISMRLPQDFLRLETDGDLRAVTGDDGRIWARVFHDDNTASLAFWSQALEHDLVDQRGYERIARGEFDGRRGAAGVWLECAANVRGERVGYLIALWVDGNDVRTVEFAARADVFAERIEAVRAALPTVRW
ncbi:MAG: hypothetical protein JNL08_13185 [Planctomycetes bacterium]|nr:hypothetical protein [Planctomycetota bacterium]